MAIFAIAAGCGDQSTATPAATPDDSGLATRSLLAVGDFPNGWTESSATANATSPLAKCQDANPSKNRTAVAESGTFSNQQGTSISQSVSVYGTTADAAASMDVLAVQLSCAVDQLNGGKFETSDVTISDAIGGTVSMPIAGDRTNAYRIRFHVVSKSSKAEADGYIDVVYVQVGRVTFGLTASTGFAPVPAALMTDLTNKAASKLPR
jgi:hypothetical protein